MDIVVMFVYDYPEYLSWACIGIEWYCLIYFEERVQGADEETLCSIC